MKPIGGRRKQHGCTCEICCGDWWDKRSRAREKRAAEAEVERSLDAVNEAATRYLNAVAKEPRR